MDVRVLHTEAQTAGLHRLLNEIRHLNRSFDSQCEYSLIGRSQIWLPSSLPMCQSLFGQDDEPHIASGG